jgi:hypothetical protein
MRPSCRDAQGCALLVRPIAGLAQRAPGGPPAVKREAEWMSWRPTLFQALGFQRKSRAVERHLAEDSPQLRRIGRVFQHSSPAACQDSHWPSSAYTRALARTHTSAAAIRVGCDRETSAETARRLCVTRHALNEVPVPRCLRLQADVSLSPRCTMEHHHDGNGCYTLRHR